MSYIFTGFTKEEVKTFCKKLRDWNNTYLVKPSTYKKGDSP
jgi:hypothetical protein